MVHVYVRLSLARGHVYLFRRDGPWLSRTLGYPEPLAIQNPWLSRTLVRLAAVPLAAAVVAVAFVIIVAVGCSGRRRCRGNRRSRWPQRSVGPDCRLLTPAPHYFPG